MLAFVLMLLELSIPLFCAIVLTIGYKRHLKEYVVITKEGIELYESRYLDLKASSAASSFFCLLLHYRAV